MSFKLKYCRWIPGLLTALSICSLSAQSGRVGIPLRSEYAKTLLELCNTVEGLQIKDPADQDNGAIRCTHCNVLHTRASESVFPLWVAFAISKETKYLNAAKRTAAWLIKQQQPDGSWKETPEEWTGTTTDQLLMLAEGYKGIEPYLSGDERVAWQKSMSHAADYLVKVMTPEWASINYVATTTATLARVNEVVPNEIYGKRARELAHRVIAKIDEDGFLTGEGGRENGNKYGVDLGYNMEMSLWGLGYYSRMTGDAEVDTVVRRALQTHIYFIYPDGSLDGSWGIRSNKWTTFGGATSDGSQVLFTLYAEALPSYATASYRNLQFLRTNIHDGYVGYGPHYWKLFTKPPCIYPTFTKAKNLALAYVLDKKDAYPSAALPTEAKGWMKEFPTIQVAEVRTNNFMVTMTAYRYKDTEKREKSKYMYRPSGGAVSNLWVEGYGLLQASSQTLYARWEPMSFPEVDTVISLTPRIEFWSGSQYFTNLFEFDGTMTTSQEKLGAFRVKTTGELRDRTWLAGGISYELTHVIGDNDIIKTVELRYHDAREIVHIVEPFVQWEGMKVKQVDERTVMIETPKGDFCLDLVEGNASWVLGRNEQHYWSPYPVLKAYPVELDVKPPQAGFTQHVAYRISIVR